MNVAIKYGFVMVGLILASSLSSYSQSRLESKGPIPEDFKKLYSQKFEESMDDERIQDLKSKSKSKEFAALTNYSVDNLLKSGKVVYGDEISSYCNEIIQNLLKERPDAADKARLYTLKSNDVNAYSTHQGIMIITTGLISRLENEEELAFVLAHEVAHMLEDHNVESFEYNSALFRKDVSSGRNDLEEKILMSAKHSKKSEFEADDLGWELYIKAGYDPQKVISGFDKLLYAYLPARQQKFNYANYEDEFFHIDSTDKRFDLKEIDAEEDVDDSKSTHPNVKRRKDNIREKMAKLTDAEIKRHGDQARFNKVRSMAYRESIYQNTIQNNYVESLILIRSKGEDISIDERFLKKHEAIAYWGLQAYTNTGTKDFVMPHMKRQGEQGAYYHFFRKLKKKEMNIVASRKLAELHLQDEDDPFLKNLLVESLIQTRSATDFDWDYFEERPEDEDEIRRADRKCFECYQAFGDTAMRNAVKDIYSNLRKITTNKAKVEQKEDVTKLVVFSPRYFGMDMRYSLDKRFMKSEEKRAYLEEQIIDYGERLDIDVKILDSWASNKMTTEDYNEYALMMDWLVERSGYSGGNFQTVLSEELDPIRTKYGTDNIAMSMYWNLLERKRFKVWYFIGSVAIIYAMPFYLYWQFTPYHYTGYTFVLLDGKNGDVDYVDSKNFDVKYRNYIIKAHLYNSLNQIAK